MKKMMYGLCALVLVLGISTVSEAGSETRSNTGCGIGSAAFQDQNDTLVIQVLAATTNGIFGNQTFGITSGTLNCSKPSKIVSNELNRFVAANLDNLAKDIAMGRGESLDTMAALMDVAPDARGEFYTTLQANFDAIFTTEQVESGDVIDNILKVTAAA